MSTKIGSLAVSLSLDADNWNGSMAQVDRSLRSMGSELKATKAMGADYGKSLDGLKSKKDILTRSVEASSIKLSEERKKYDELVESGKASEAQLERQAKKVNDAQAQYNRLTTELNEVDKALKVQSSSWTQFGEKLEATGAKMKSVGDSMTSVGKKLSMSVTASIVAAGAAAFKMAVDYESAFAGVRKTVDMTETEFAALSDGIRNLSKEIPAAATEIAGVAEAAGQLGIKNEAILGFTRTMVDMGVATNMSSDQAATALARFANITQMSQQDFDRLGSTIVDLGNNLATTESEIVEMGLRLAGAGKQVGMTEAQIMSFSGALSSVGIEAEAGGSAFSKVMVNMQLAVETGGKDLENFANVAGMSASDFKKAFQDDAAGAIITFIEGLASAEERGLSAIGMLDEMGIKEVRLRDSLLRAAGASDVFSESLKIGTNAWEENNALTNEAEERYKTTASQMKILWNQITDIGISLGEVLIPKVQALMDKLTPLIERFANMSTESQNMILAVGGIAAAIGPLLVAGGTLMAGMGGIITTAGTLSTAIGAAGGATAFFAGKLAILTGPIGLTVAAIGAIGFGAVALGKHLSEDALPEVDRFGEGVSEATEKALTAFFELSDGASQSLSELFLTSTEITEELGQELVSKFADMNTQIVDGMNERHDEQMASMESFFLNSSVLTDEEEAKILQKKQETHDLEIEIQEAKNQIVADIIKNATEEKRELTEHENEVINNIIQQGQEQAVQIMSESEVEQKIILEKLKENASIISAEQAAEVVKNSVEQREKSIAEIEAQYDETIGHIIRMRDETGDITEEQATRLIAEAERTKDESVKHAENMHNDVVEQAKLQAEEHVNEVDWSTGEIKSKWEVMRGDVVESAKEMRSEVKDYFFNMLKDTVEKVEEIKTNVSNKFTETKEAINTKMTESVTAVKDKMTEMVGAVTGKASDFLQAGKDLVSGLINGIKKMKEDAIDSITGVVDGVVNKAKSLLGIKSPSRVFMAVGEDTVKGYEVGVKARQKHADLAVKNLFNGILKVTEIAHKAESDVNKKNNAEIKKIEQRASEDIHLIKQKALKSKRKLTEAELIRIRRIEEDSSNKILNLKEKNNKEEEKLNAAQLKDLKKHHDEVLKTVNKYVSDKKKNGEMSLQDEIYFWNAMYRNAEKGSELYELALGNHQKAVKEMRTEIESVNKEYNDRMLAIDKEYNDESQKLHDEWNKAYESRMNQLLGFAGIFDEFKKKTEISGQDLIANLESQVGALDEYGEVIGSLGSRIDDDALLDELKSLGVKSLGELQALNSLSDDELSNYVDLYKKKFDLAREQATTELEPLRGDIDEQLVQLKEDTAKRLDELNKEWQRKINGIVKGTAKEFDSMHQVGVDAMQGLGSGMASMSGQLMAQAQSIADSIKSTIQSAFDINSPSRWMRDMIGKNMMVGWIDGIESMKSKVVAVSVKAAEWMAPDVSGLSASNFNGINKKVDSGTVQDNSKSVVNNVTVQSNDSNAVRDTERMLRRLAYQL